MKEETKSTPTLSEAEIKRLKKENKDLSKQLSLKSKEINWQSTREINIKEISKKILGYDLLPYPRMEMVVEKTTIQGYKIQWIYGLVYKHFIDYADKDKLIMNVFSKTGGNGSKNLIENFYPETDNNLPFRDGLHIKTEMLLLNIPGYIRNNKEIREIIISEEITKHLKNLDVFTKMNINETR